MQRQSILALSLYASLILTFSLYYPGLHGPLLLDDFENLRPLAELSQGITTWRDVLTTSSSGALGRPITMLSFIANQLTSGGEVWSYKYTNLMIHLLCGTLVFWLCGRLLQEHSLKPYSWTIALWVTALWLLTPLQVSTVLYVIQRMAQLSTLFVLAGLITYVIARQNLEHRPKLGVALILSCFSLWWPIAILSKENGVLLPLLTFITEIFFFRFRAPCASRRFLITLYVLLLLLPAFALTVKIFLDPGFILNGYKSRDFTLTERLLTQSRILFSYLWTLLIPYGPGLGLFHDDYLKSTGLLTPITTLLSMATWISMAVMAALSLKAQSGPLNKYSYFLFGVLFFLAAHVLESSVFSLELYFEHRNYLPAVGVYFSLGIALFSLVRTLKRQRFFFALLALLPLAHAGASYPRIQTWISWEHILLSAAQTHPQSARVHGDLAIYYSNNHSPEQAFLHLREAVKWKPRLITAAAIWRLAVHCQNSLPIPPGEYDQLRHNLSFSDSTSTKNAFSIFASLLRTNPCPQLDLVQFNSAVEQWFTQREALEHSDTVWFVHIALGKMFSHRNLLTEAINQMDQAMKLYPERLEPGLIKFQYHMALGDLEEAWQTLAWLKRRDSGSRIDLSRAIRNFDVQLQALNKASEL